jgi:hypothetical protein
MSWSSQMNYFLLLTIYLIEWHKFFADYILDRWFCMVTVWIVHCIMKEPFCMVAVWIVHCIMKEPFTVVILLS